MKNTVKFISVKNGHKITWENDRVFLDLLLSAVRSAIHEEKKHLPEGKNR